MDISYLKTNHIKTPMGIAMEKPIFSWCVEKSTGKIRGRGIPLYSRQV